MSFKESEGTDGVVEAEDVPIRQMKTVVTAGAPGSGVPGISTTDDLADGVASRVNAVLGDTSSMEAETAPASTFGTVVENPDDTLFVRLIERGTARVREDIAGEVGHAAEQLFGTQEQFEAQIRATIASERLNDPRTFERMLTRAATFLFRDRIIEYAARRDNEGVTAGEAQRTIVEIIEHAMRTRGQWLADMLTRHNLWVAPQDTHDQHAA